MQPRFLLKPNQAEYTINEEEPFTLKCETDRNVYKDSYWTKDGVSITSNVNTTISDVTRTMTYSVKKLSVSDGGEYRCVAIYWRGEVKNNRTIRVIVKGMHLRQNYRQIIDF